MKIMKKTKTIIDIQTSEDLFKFAVAIKVFTNQPKRITVEIDTKINLLLIEKDSISMTEFRKFLSSLFTYKASNSMNYLLEHGYSPIEAKEHLYKNGKKGYDQSLGKRTNEKISIDAKKANKIKQIKLNKLKITNPNAAKAQFNTNIEYYLEQGLTEKEAKKALSLRQHTFSKDKLTARFGEEKGTILLTARNKKWITTLKKNNNWVELSKRKGKSLEELKFKYGNDKALEIIKSRTTHSKMLKASVESLEVFNPLIDWLINEEFIIFDDVYLGVEDSREFFIRDEKTGRFLYSFDFTIPKLNLIIEYNGEAFHPNPKWTEERLNSWKSPYSSITAKEKILYDSKKILKANQLGFRTLEIWSSSTTIDNIESCKTFILQ